MKFKDYLTVKQYYLANAKTFNRGISPPRPIKEKENSRMQERNPYHQDIRSSLYQIPLVAAKCYYL
jgi:hypothetical protein